jgi:hypothetical protein
VFANVDHNDKNMKLFQRFHCKRFRRKRFTKSSVSYEDDDGPLDDLTGITKRTKKKKAKGDSLLLPSSMTRRLGLRRKQMISSDNYFDEDTLTVAVTHSSTGGYQSLVEDDSGRTAEDGALPSHSRPRDYTQSTWTWEESSPFVSMIMILFIIIVVVVEMVKRRRRTAAKRTFVKSRTKSLNWNTSTFTTITIGQSMEDEDIGETTT